VRARRNIVVFEYLYSGPRAVFLAWAEFYVLFYQLKTLSIWLLPLKIFFNRPDRPLLAPINNNSLPIMSRSCCYISVCIEVLAPALTFWTGAAQRSCVVANLCAKLTFNCNTRQSLRSFSSRLCKHVERGRPLFDAHQKEEQHARRVYNIATVLGAPACGRVGMYIGIYIYVCFGLTCFSVLIHYVLIVYVFVCV